MIHIWEQLAHSLLTLDPTLAVKRGEERRNEGRRPSGCRRAHSRPLHARLGEEMVGQMQSPQHRCGQQREEGISFAGLGERTLGPAAVPSPSAGFKWYIASHGWSRQLEGLHTGMSQASAPLCPEQVALNLSPEGSLSPDAAGVETETLKAGHVLDAQGERLLKATPTPWYLGHFTAHFIALSYEESIRRVCFPPGDAANPGRPRSGWGQPGRKDLLALLLLALCRGGGRDPHHD